MGKDRPAKLAGFTYEVKTPCGPMYVTCNDHEGELFEVFIKLGKAGGCAAAFTEAVGKTISNAIRSNIDPSEMIRSTIGIKCHLSTNGEDSCISSIGAVIQLHLKEDLNEI
jgi:ribonucleoside-diphosphate reductase alpha chain